MVHTSNGGARKCAIREDRLQVDVNASGRIYAHNNDKVNDLRQRMCPVDDGDSSLRRIGHGRNCLVQRHVELSASRRKQIHLHERHVEPTTFSYVCATLKLHLVISSQHHEAPTQADVRPRPVHCVYDCISNSATTRKCRANSNHERHRVADKARRQRYDTDSCD